jgi:hypothetical protein
MRQRLSSYLCAWSGWLVPLSFIVSPSSEVAQCPKGIRDVETSPILAGLSPAQLKVWIVAGLVVAGILFFA